jgi:aspartate/methionine/tyrosine aminotransferase
MKDFKTAINLNLQTSQDLPLIPFHDSIASYEKLHLPDNKLKTKIFSLYENLKIDTTQIDINSSYGAYGAYRLIVNFCQLNKLLKTTDGNIKHEKIFTNLGLQINYIKSENNNSFPDLILLKKEKNAIIYVNATDGRFVNSAYVSKLYKIIQENKLLLILDLDSQFLVHSKKKTPVSIILKNGLPNNVFVVCTTSKEFGLPGLRYGYILSNNVTAKSLGKFKSEIMEMEPHLSKTLATLLISNNLIDQNKKIIEQRMFQAMNILSENGVVYIKPDTGINLFIKSHNPHNLVNKLQKKGIYVGLGSQFGPKFASYVRWTVAQPAVVQKQALHTLIKLEKT